MFNYYRMIKNLLTKSEKEKVNVLPQEEEKEEETFKSLDQAIEYWNSNLK